LPCQPSNHAGCRGVICATGVLLSIL
jgi:hypothetical protein